MYLHIQLLGHELYFGEVREPSESPLERILPGLATALMLYLQQSRHEEPCSKCAEAPFEPSKVHVTPAPINDV